MSEKSKILEIKNYFKKASAIDEDVSNFNKDELSIFRRKKGLEEIKKLSFQGKFHIDDNDDEIG